VPGIKNDQRRHQYQKSNKAECAIKGFFLKRVSSVQSAEDLTQEVFLKIVKQPIGNEIESVKSWIFKIAKNTLIDYYRKNKPTDELGEILNPSTPDHNRSHATSWEPYGHFPK